MHMYQYKLNHESGDFPEYLDIETDVVVPRGAVRSPPPTRISIYVPSRILWQ